CAVRLTNLRTTRRTCEDLSILSFLVFIFHFLFSSLSGSVLVLVFSFLFLFFLQGYAKTPKHFSPQKHPIILPDQSP
ncbi:TPA: hypothetical protein ACHX5T_004138, partial [Shigella flexneri]